ncbi:MAG: hypothetical protein IPK66_11680 [Rhodospirillales bacterium]|nr:hypothetical protein [Rhodospirillales bacterium]
MTSACLYVLRPVIRFDRTSLMVGPNGSDKKARRVDRRNRSQDARRAADGSAPVADAFNRWLNDKLNSLYDPVLREPIPEDLLELIESYRADDESDK